VTDPTHPLHGIETEIATMVGRILELAAADPDGAEKLVDELPPGTVAMLCTYRDFDEWQKARGLRDLAVAADWTGLREFLSSNRDGLPGILAKLESVGPYGAAVDRSVAADLVGYQQAMGGAADEVHRALSTRPGLSVPGS
jgi:hypothetical protein